MRQAYTVERLPPESVDQAFPLIQAIHPSLNRARWHSLYSRLREQGGEPAVLVVTAATRRFQALCCMEMGHGRLVLSISRLLINTSLDGQGIGAALLAALAEEAKAAGCSLLRIETNGTDGSAVRALTDAQATLAVGLAIEVV
jgi:GNAT superfamily N-acetyltransferase